MFTYSNNLLTLSILSLTINESSKFKNGNGINLISARKLKVNIINIGCEDCEEYLDFD